MKNRSPEIQKKCGNIIMDILGRDYIDTEIMDKNGMTALSLAQRDITDKKLVKYIEDHCVKYLDHEDDKRIAMIIALKYPTYKII